MIAYRLKELDELVDDVEPMAEVFITDAVAGVEDEDDVDSHVTTITSRAILTPLSTSSCR